jgi:hypothetical protein
MVLHLHGAACEAVHELDPSYCKCGIDHTSSLSQVELMRSENVLLTFTEGAIREIARVAFLVSTVPLPPRAVLLDAPWLLYLVTCALLCVKWSTSTRRFPQYLRSGSSLVAR